jgi:protein-S-isoprenylcysteine O-methyltransferase Ste14
MAAAFWLLFSRNPQLGFMSRPIFPDLPLIHYLGLVLTCAGLAFTVWARAILGRNWSAIVTIRQDHRLVRQGPYRWVRHPIYSGLLLAMLGTAICFGELRGLIGVALGLVGFWLKARLEETFLIEQFGSEYTEYKKEVKALIPSIL